MKKIRINAAALVRDIKQRTGLKNLMEKHDLSYPNLLKVRSILVKRSYVTQEEFDYLNLPDGPVQQSLSAKGFLASFRDRPDDLYLMERYKLTVKELQGIYDTLILAGLLSEYEYHSRIKKAPELEEAACTDCEDSTEVTLVRDDLEPRCVIPQRGGDIAPRKSFPHDSVTDRAALQGLQNTRPKFDSHAALSAGEEPGSRHCPKCGILAHPSSPDACIRCGVVFSKAKRDPKYEGVAVWEFECADRGL
jgi:hypothetical protein